MTGRNKKYLFLAFILACTLTILLIVDNASRIEDHNTTVNDKYLKPGTKIASVLVKDIIATPRSDPTQLKALAKQFVIKRDTQQKSRRILVYKLTTWLESKNITKINLTENCPAQNCIIDFDKRNVFRSDAVIFHLWGPQEPLKLKRPNGQVWILNQHEAPPQYDLFVPPHYENQINWTMSYSAKSDIYLPYGTVREKQKETVIKRNYLQIAKNKTKDALWIVSHCHTHSKRHEYVAKLKKYITVDILGACGKKWNCGRRWYHDDGNCFDILNTTYRYYLAFENSLCDDYVTEKFFENYKYDIIQIVRAGNPKERLFHNISRDAFVSANDFRNVHELGKYLKALSNDKLKYAAMLEAKDKYETVHYIEHFKDATCQICQRLNNVDRYRSVYQDNRHWMKEQRCFFPRDYYG